MSRKPINIPAEPARDSQPVPPELISVYRAAILKLKLFIAFALFGAVLLLLLLWLGQEWLLPLGGVCLLGAAGFTIITLIRLSRKS